MRACAAEKAARGPSRRSSRLSRAVRVLPRKQGILPELSSEVTEGIAAAVLVQESEMSPELSLESANLNNVVTTVASLLQQVVSGQLVLRITLEPKLRPIRAEGRQMQWLLVNLLTRAYDALQPFGSLFVTTNNHLDANQIPWVRLEIGITRGRLEAGSAAREIVERLNGILSIHETHGEGSSLVMLFPG